MRVWKPGLHPRERTHEVRVDAEPRRPRIELRPHVRTGRDETARRNRHAQALAEHDRLRRIDPVRARERSDRRAVALRDRRERVADLHDVHDGRDDHAMNAHRHTVAPHDRRQRPRTDDRVDVEVHLRLVAAQRGRRLLPHVAVQCARVHPTPREEELQHRDVPAEVAAPQDPRTEERLTERPERKTCAGVRRTDRQPVRTLERMHRRRRARAGDAVDLCEIQPVRAQGDLQPRNLGVDAGVNCRDCRQRSDGDDEREHATHERAPFGPPQAAPPRLTLVLRAEPGAPPASARPARPRRRT